VTKQKLELKPRIRLKTLLNMRSHVQRTALLRLATAQQHSTLTSILGDSVALVRVTQTRLRHCLAGCWSRFERTRSLFCRTRSERSFGSKIKNAFRTFVLALGTVTGPKTIRHHLGYVPHVPRIAVEGVL